MASSTPLPLLPGDLVDWPRRLAAERGLLERVLATARSRRVLDLGCGSGEHARLLAELGCEVVAIDASETALERARQAPVPAGVEFVQGDLGAVERLGRGHFGAAFCLGNTLPCLLSPESLSRMLIGLKRRLLPGSPFLLQQLDYDRILATGESALPVEMVTTPAGERVVVRLVEPRDDGIVVHTTVALRRRPAAVPAMAVAGTRTDQLRGWRRAELELVLEVARWSIDEVYGDMAATPHREGRSRELVMVVR